MLNFQQWREFVNRGVLRPLSSQLAVERVAEVEARSAGLRKELGLIDLVLMQIMYVVGSGWVGTAAKLGTSHTVFWLLEERP